MRTKIWRLCPNKLHCFESFMCLDPATAASFLPGDSSVDVWLFLYPDKNMRCFFVCLFLWVFFAVPSSVPTSEALLPRRSSRAAPPTSGHTQGSFRIVTPPPEVHRGRRQIVGGLPSEGNTALLPSPLGGVQ